ncbi:hypothetical protein RJT34_17151 [Clitoria ternatea]|uniref:Uncharacterized protein n=1 Tax=Clitoria ternatea TaxID=43366 RepID=A0AAN9JBJ0_CLITE
MIMVSKHHSSPTLRSSESFPLSLCVGFNESNNKKVNEFLAYYGRVSDDLRTPPRVFGLRFSVDPPQKLSFSFACCQLFAVQCLPFSVIIYNTHNHTNALYAHSSFLSSSSSSLQLQTPLVYFILLPFLLCLP